MLRCTYYKKYKGIRPPKCLGGVGCDKCWRIYNDRRNANRITATKKQTF